MKKYSSSRYDEKLVVRFNNNRRIQRIDVIYDKSD